MVSFLKTRLFVETVCFGSEENNVERQYATVSHEFGWKMFELRDNCFEKDTFCCR